MDEQERRKRPFGFAGLSSLATDLGNIGRGPPRARTPSETNAEGKPTGQGAEPIDSGAGAKPTGRGTETIDSGAGARPTEQGTAPLDSGGGEQSAGGGHVGKWVVGGVVVAIAVGLLSVDEEPAARPNETPAIASPSPSVQYRGTVTNSLVPSTPATFLLVLEEAELQVPGIDGLQFKGSVTIGEPLEGSGPAVAVVQPEAGLILISVSANGDTILWLSEETGASIGGRYSIPGGPYRGQDGTWSAILAGGDPLSTYVARMPDSSSAPPVTPSPPAARPNNSPDPAPRAPSRDQSGKPDLTQLSAAEQQMIEGACAVERQVGGPADYYDCLSAQQLALNAIRIRPDLSTLGSAERQMVESACSVERQVQGAAAYYECLAGQLRSLARAGGMPDMSAVSATDREMLESACAVERQVQGPAAYYSCVTDQLRALASSIGKPDLSEIAGAEREMIESACSVERQVQGPAAYYACVSEQNLLLIELTARPDFSKVTLAERQMIESACSVERRAQGPAAYYTCASTQIRRLGRN